MTHVPDCARREAGKLLLDADALARTLSRIAHEIIEANPDLGAGRARRHPDARRPARAAPRAPDRGARRRGARARRRRHHLLPRRRARPRRRGAAARAAARARDAARLPARGPHGRARRRRPLHGPHDPRRDRGALRLRPPGARPARRHRRPRPPRAADPPGLRRQEPADRALASASRCSCSRWTRSTRSCSCPNPEEEIDERVHPARARRPAAAAGRRRGATCSRSPT